MYEKNEISLQLIAKIKFYLLQDPRPDRVRTRKRLAEPSVLRQRSPNTGSGYLYIPKFTTLKQLVLSTIMFCFCLVEHHLN